MLFHEKALNKDYLLTYVPLPFYVRAFFPLLLSIHVQRHTVAGGGTELARGRERVGKLFEYIFKNSAVIIVLR